MKNVTPPKFDGTMSGDVVEAWLIEMEKYFEIKNYFEVTKAVWGTYKLAGEAST